MKLQGIFKVALLACSALSFSVSANLIENGSFEVTDDRVGVQNGRTLSSLDASNSWDVYTSLPGWSVVGGLAGIEVEAETVVSTPFGNHYVELDSHGANSNTSIFQWFDVLDAGHYETSFWYRPRTTNQNDNGMNVLFGDNIFINTIFTLNEVRHQGTVWQEYNVDLGFLDAGSYSLGFQAFGSENTLGAFLDNVSVHGVPEPGSLALLGLGMLGLVASRRKQKQ